MPTKDPDLLFSREGTSGWDPSCVSKGWMALPCRWSFLESPGDGVKGLWHLLKGMAKRSLQPECSSDPEAEQRDSAGIQPPLVFMSFWLKVKDRRERAHSNW